MDILFAVKIKLALLDAFIGISAMRMFLQEKWDP